MKPRCRSKRHWVVVACIGRPTSLLKIILWHSGVSSDLWSFKHWVTCGRQERILVEHNVGPKRSSRKFKKLKETQRCQLRVTGGSNDCGNAITSPSHLAHHVTKATGLTQTFPWCGATCSILPSRAISQLFNGVNFVYRSVEVYWTFCSYLRVLVRIRNFYWRTTLAIWHVMF